MNVFVYVSLNVQITQPHLFSATRDTFPCSVPQPPRKTPTRAAASSAAAAVACRVCRHDVNSATQLVEQHYIRIHLLCATCASLRHLQLCKQIQGLVETVRLEKVLLHGCDGLEHSRVGAYVDLVAAVVGPRS
eukprot:5255209-Pleurochrysis_carterae.AAC.1